MQIAHVVANFVLWGFEQEGRVRQKWVLCDAREGFAPYVAESYVPVAINPGIIFRFGIVEMNRANMLQRDVSLKRFESG